MAVTNYYSVEGEILGEATGGVRTDYLTDALGSVTGTVNAFSVVVNTYRYKPYGATLAKTGTGSDPIFGWVGSAGYAQTGKAHSEVYVRARHYSSTSGRWTSKDPLGQDGGDWNYYRYVQNRAVDWTDPSGLINLQFSGCEKLEKALITIEFTRICSQLGDKYRECLDDYSCGATYPAPPSDNNDSGNSMSDCIKGWCNNTSEKSLKINCNHSYWGHRIGSCSRGACGASEPGKQITICSGHITQKKLCDPLECVLAHELIHVCGKVGHSSGTFSCVEKMGKQCTSKSAS